MRRTTVLLATLVAAAGLLAACDLPGGSPGILGPDRVPNDTQGEAPTLQDPLVVNGSVDTVDLNDWFRLAAPAVERGLYLRCTGDPYVQISVSYESLQAQSPLNPSCNGEERFITNVPPGAEIFLGRAHQEQGPDFQPYTLYASYGPLGVDN